MIHPSEQKNKLYQVVKVYKNKDSKKIILKNLTEQQAQTIVKTDIENNPNPKKSMLIYQLQKN